MTCICCDGETQRFGRFKNRNRTVQRYRCVKCGKTFSEDQPLNGLRVEPGKTIQIVKLLSEGCGIRAISRLTGCHTHTVMAVLYEVGQACDGLHDKLVRDVKSESIQIDELWSKIGRCQRRSGPGDALRGDFYTFLAVAAREKLIISYHTGKRDEENTDVFVRDLASRCNGRVQITTDGFIPYPSVIRKHLLGRLDYAVLVKQYAATPAEVEASRRYSPAPFVGIKRSIKAGNPRRDRICTSHVERTNLTVRHFNKRFARLGLGWSRKLANHLAAISIFTATYNWCKVHSTMGCTPAMGTKLTDHTWTVEELVERAISN